jgi:RNA polymerase sigma-70 factor (ECF subfamily)
LPPRPDEHQHQAHADELYRRFGPLVLRRARRFLGPTEAQDIAHEVFVRVLTDKASFTADTSPVSWLYRVTTRLCLNHLRDQQRQHELRLRHGPTELMTFDPGHTPEARAFLDALWRTLDEELAMIGVLHYLDGLTTADIGRMLGVSDRTIANRLKALTTAARRAAGEEAP